MADNKFKVINFAGSSLTTHYQILVAASRETIKAMKIYNGSNLTAIISFDGVTDHVRIPTLKEFDLNAYDELGKELPKTIYIKSTAAGTGNIDGFIAS